MIVLADIPELEYPVVDQLLVSTGGFCPVVFVANEIAELLLGQRKHLAPELFVERYSVWTDAAPITQAESPEVDSLSLLRPHTDTDCEKFFCIGFLEFQIEITGGFLTFSVTKEIEVHFAVSGTKRVQAFWTLIAVEKEGDKALSGNGFSRGVIATQQDVSILYQKFLVIIQPEIHKPQLMHLPAVHPQSPL